MMPQRHIVLIPYLMAILLAGCDRPDETGVSEESSTPVGIERFLLFPNPIVQTGGGFETDTNAYAEAYYRAVDPTGQKDTLNKWKTANGFGSGTGTEHLVVFRDVKDLGYGRRMTGRRNTDNSVAFFVENYNVVTALNSGYSSLNVDAAITRDSKWHIGTNAIEWSTSPCTTEDPLDCNPNIKFAKYYNFSPSGQRQLAVDLDGKGLKAMPGPCITCHGGRGDPLTPNDAATGKPRFALVENSQSRKRGDTQARLHGFEVGTFEFSTQPGFTRTAQEASLKDFNQWVLCTYPLPAGSPGEPALDSCRQAAGTNEWQGTAAEMIKAWYGGTGANGMPNPAFADSYVPSGWSANSSLYNSVVKPFCRTCHVLRGTGNQSDLDFMTLAKFQGYADRTKAHVFDRGNMPLAMLIYNDFWRSSAPGTLARYIDTVLGARTATTASDEALRPGRPIADPGPNRMVRTGANAALSAADSLFATTYSWLQVGGPATAGITNADAMIAAFFAPLPGEYTVRLTVGDGARTDSKDVVITVDDNFTDPSMIRFAHVRNVLQNVSTCTNCHTPAAQPPIAYTDENRNGDAATDATDEEWFLKELAGRVNLSEIQASPLLRKPSGNHHNGGTLFDVATSAGLRNYSILYNWILAGIPAGGVAANAGADSSESVDFSGTPFSASIALDGTASINATTFSWSIVSAPPSFSAPSITNPTSATATLRVTNVGTYIVQLTVSDGRLSDTARRTITVSEAPITANFEPQTGTTVVTFTSTGNITLFSTSTGSPSSCRWEVLSGPPGATLDGSTTLDVAKPCTTIRFIGIFPRPITVPNTAILNVPAAAIGGIYQVRLTASTIGSSSVTHSITVGNGTPVVADILANSGATPVVRTFTGGNPATGLASTASVSLNGGGSSGVLPLTFAWSILSQPDATNGPATLSSTTASAPTLTVRATGSYTVRLQITDAVGNIAATTNTFPVTPTHGTTFATMTTIFGPVALGGQGCTGCHSGTSANPANNSGPAPSWQNLTGSDGSTLWRRAFQRIAVGNPTNSLLILNPNNVTNTINTNGHGGLCRSGFPCAGSTTISSQFENWINSGGPPGN